MSHTVVLSDNKTVDPETQSEILEAAGAEIEVLDAKTEDAAAEAFRDADGAIVDAATPVTERVLAGAENLRVVGRAGIGVDNVDVAAAAEHGIAVVNVPDYGLDEVSTHALSLILACARSVPRYDRGTRDGEWDWKAGRPMFRVRGKTVGLAGFGGIARRLASKLQSFGVDVLAYDPNVEAERMIDLGAEKVDFDGLLARSDYVSVHVPLFEETRGLFDAEAFAAMKEEAILVNTARGGVIDEDDLAAALENDEIGRAGLDVLRQEPPEPDNPLLSMEEVVVTPHAGWYSEESRRDLSRGVARDVAAVLAGEEPKNPVDPDTPWV
jgi:D-3-phosphoglycerate dehydrogenase